MLASSNRFQGCANQNPKKLVAEHLLNYPSASRSELAQLGTSGMRVWGRLRARDIARPSRARHFTEFR